MRVKFRYIVFVILVVSIILFTANLEKQIIQSEDPFWEAYNIIFDSTTFSYKRVGYAGSIPKEIEAVNTILGYEDCKSYFRELAEKATMAGKLYALCALYFVDNEYYNELIGIYCISSEMVQIMSGCLVFYEPVKNVIKSENAIRLNGVKDSINLLSDKSNINSFTVDFYGGGIPSLVMECIEQERSK